MSSDFSDGLGLLILKALNIGPPALLYWLIKRDTRKQESKNQFGASDEPE